MVATEVNLLYAEAEMSVEVVIGLQRGDEGKGRFVDMLAEESDIVARFNGGNNAGHRVTHPDGRILDLHSVPCGITHEHTMNVIGSGAFINPVKLVEEMEDIRSKGFEVSPENLKISSATQLLLGHHISKDEIFEAGPGKQGSTKVGMAPAAAHKMKRIGLQANKMLHDPSSLYPVVHDALYAQRAAREAVGLEPLNEKEVALEYFACARRLGAYVTDTVTYLNEQLYKEEPAHLLAEGAQAFLLDIDHGAYPFVTSSTTTSGGVSPGLGIPPGVDRITGVAKALQSHVGGGDFVTEIHDEELLERLHGDMDAPDAEKGTTTGRVRRLGYLDIPQIRRANMVNGTHDMALSKVDVLPRYGDDLKICVAYELNGQTIQTAPTTDMLRDCTPIYESLPNWTEDIQEIREFEDLPENAQNYVRKIEDLTQVAVSMVGVGPNRDQVIVRYKH